MATKTVPAECREVAFQSALRDDMGTLSAEEMELVDVFRRLGASMRKLMVEEVCAVRDFEVTNALAHDEEFRRRLADARDTFTGRRRSKLRLVPVASA